MIRTDFTAFRQSLTQNADRDLIGVRHEMFFVGARRRRGVQTLVCLVAFIRDLWWIFACCRRPADAPAEACAALLVASLPGAGGLGALRPLEARLRAAGTSCLLYVHPRLRSMDGARLPVRPTLLQLLRALGPALRLRRAPAGFDRTALALLLARSALWTQTWRATMAHHRDVGAAYVHNDFDMFLKPAVDVMQGLGLDVTCVQHGVPTAEFFPPNAVRQRVWSPAMADIYRLGGARTLEIDPPRALASERRIAGRPLDSVVHLISQTHTIIYGRGLSGHLFDLASTLRREFGEDRTLVLLHPQEARDLKPWLARAPARMLRRPPHEAFAHSACVTRVFVGFSSTAMIEAAANGHIVISADIPYSDSCGAREIMRPPLVAKPDAIAPLIRALAGDPARVEATLAAQDRWLCESIGAKV